MKTIANFSDLDIDKVIKKMKQRFYYFCHPYSTKTEKGRIANYELCCRRSARLLLKGYNIFSPIVHSHTIEIASPEMLKWSYEKRWEFWMSVDMAVLEYVEFTGVILAPGWGRSRGCKKEYEWFLLRYKSDGSPYDILKYNDIIGD